jgi:hypothetical protein
MTAKIEQLYKDHDAFERRVKSLFDNVYNTEATPTLEEFIKLARLAGFNEMDDTMMHTLFTAFDVAIGAELQRSAWPLPRDGD